MENYQAVFKRKEIKYLLSSEERNALLPILEAHMEPDAFAHSSISNLYYDTPDFRMVRRSLEKPMYKEKLRLRSYGTPENTSTVFPEILFRTDRLDLREGAFGEAILLPDQTLMEVKISNAAPLWLAQALSEIGIFPVSFSKYGRAYERICRDPRWRKEMNGHTQIDAHTKINGPAEIDAHTKINKHTKEMEMKRYA